MKIQCSCGAKYELEVTPEMAAQPVRFTCSACGVDASEFVNQLIQQHLGQQPASSPATAAAPTLRRASAPAEASPPAAESTPEAVICRKHLGVAANEQCRVCGKPICPKCMELFGYVCSPLCRANAERRGLDIPVFEGQSTVVDARRWRKVVWGASSIGVIVLLLLGAWGWYAWVGSQPHVAFSRRYDKPSYSGQTRMCGTDQLIALHGATLLRYDLKQRKEIWSRQVLDPRDLAPSDSGSLSAGDKEEYEQRALRWAASELELRVKERNIWVISPEKLMLCDFDSGRTLKESPLGQGGTIQRNDELLVLSGDTSGKYTITHWDLAKAESKTEEIVVTQANNNATKGQKGAAAKVNRAAGLTPGASTQGGRAALDPLKIAAQVQAMSQPARIALPALLANSLNQERILMELNDAAATANPGTGSPTSANESSLLLPAREGFVKLSVKLIESRIVARTAMKAKPAKSVLDGDLNVTQTTEVANEILNDMQRSRGGDVVHEDQSRYQVTISQPGGSNQWIGTVVGPPVLHTLETVNVLTAGTTLLVFDRSIQLRWKSELSFRVQPDQATMGQGPCVERDGALFVCDEGVVSAFDLATGSPRWRLPTIGAQGLFFGDQGMLYINTTTASPEKLKYSRQIDISEKIAAEILKVDSRTGKTIWKARPGGFVAYVQGQFVYTLQSHTPDEDESSTPLTGFETPAYTRVRRLDPETGQQLWEHFQDRAPLDVQFEQNTIRLVFKKEVQVLRFLTL